MLGYQFEIQIDDDPGRTVLCFFSYRRPSSENHCYVIITGGKCLVVIRNRELFGVEPGEVILNALGEATIEAVWQL